MIERIPDQIQVQTGEWRGTTFDIIPKETFAMACRKINELVDAVNGILDYAPLEMAMKAEKQNIDIGELAYLQKENGDLKDEIDILETELDRTRKALDVAVDALKYANKCIKGGCVNWETEIDKALEQITALEQKE